MAIQAGTQEEMLGSLMIAVTAGIISYDCNCVVGDTCTVPDVLLVMAIVGAPIAIIYIAFKEFVR
jgi:hypothetical protein